MEEELPDGSKVRGVLAVVTGRITACVSKTMNWTDKRTGVPMSRTYWEATVFIKRCGYSAAEVADDLIEKTGIFDVLDPEEDGPLLNIQVVISNDSREKATDVNMRYLRHAEAPRAARPPAPVRQTNGTGTPHKETAPV